MTRKAKRITAGPQFHWFGYYDKLQFDAAGGRVLGMEVDFEGRSPTAEDVIRVGMVDLADGCAWRELGTSRSWCWQQGCMLQWVPGRDGEILWNDREGERFVCRVLNVDTGARRTIPMPVYALAPDGKNAVATDFRRVNDTRPGYGYPGVADPNRDVLAPEDSGVWRVDLETGAAELIVSIAEIAALPYPHGDLSATKHWFNHLLVNPAGDRFVFLHRWLANGRAFATRMLTAKLDGSDVCVVEDSGMVSHFYWRDAGHILMFAAPHGGERAFYVYDARTGERELVLDERRDGHCVYLPGGEWIMTDTYPQGPERVQELYLYNPATGARRPLVAFPAPPAYAGEWRCDLHARVSRDGKKVCLDSAHELGRQMYLLEP